MVVSYGNPLIYNKLIIISKLYILQYLGFFLFNNINPLSPKIDFYVDLLIYATSWPSNHKFMLLSKIFKETYYL